MLCERRGIMLLHIFSAAFVKILWVILDDQGQLGLKPSMTKVPQRNPTRRKRTLLFIMTYVEPTCHDEPVNTLSSTAGSGAYRAVLQLSSIIAMLFSITSFRVS